MGAADRWAEELEAWSIPEEILAQAPESPWGFPTHLFAAEHSPTGALHAVAREALAGGGSVLDIGCGGGAASVPLAPPATRLFGVDSLPPMLEAFSRSAASTGVPHTEQLGQWPDIADQVPLADVVVCRNVVYNIADIVPFVIAMSEHAERRVVVELTETHPSVGLRSLWMRFWNLPRPSGPEAGLFGEVLRDLGIDAAVRRENRPSMKARLDPPEHVAFIRRRLCLDDTYDAEIAAALDHDPHIDETTAVVFAWTP